MDNIKLYGAGKQAYPTNEDAMKYLFNWYLNEPNVQSSFKVLGNLFHRVGSVQTIENSLVLIRA